MKQFIVLMSTVILGLVIGGLIIGFGSNAKEISGAATSQLGNIKTVMTDTSNSWKVN